MGKAIFVRFVVFERVIDVSTQGADNYKVDLPSMPYLSPEAASLGKYGEIPVSEYTGVSQIFSDINKQH